MKCTKCGKELSDGCIFCNECGTKQYAFDDEFNRTGKLILNIKKCSIYRMGVIPVACEFRLFDNRIDVVDLSERYQMTAVPAQVVSVEESTKYFGSSKGIKINMSQNKSTVLTFLPVYSDFIPYLLNMLSAWKNAPL